MSELTVPIVLALAGLAAVVFIVIMTSASLETTEFVPPEKYIPNEKTSQKSITPADLFKTTQFTLEDIKMLQDQVCGNLPNSLEDVNSTDPRIYEPWLPHEVNFQYLKPKYHFLEMGCLMWPTGMISAHFLVNDQAEIITPNKNETIFLIETPEQAFEYLEFFYHGQSSGTYIIKTDKEVQGIQEHCDHLQTFPIDGTRIARSIDAFIVEIIVSDMNSGYVNYEKWNITSDGIGSNRIDVVPLANCHAVI